MKARNRFKLPSIIAAAAVIAFAVAACGNPSDGTAVIIDWNNVNLDGEWAGSAPSGDITLALVGASWEMQGSIEGEGTFTRQGNIVTLYTADHAAGSATALGSRSSAAVRAGSVFATVTIIGHNNIRIQFAGGETFSLVRVPAVGAGNLRGTWVVFDDYNVALVTIGDDFWVFADPWGAYSVGGAYVRIGNTMRVYEAGTNQVGVATFHPASGNITYRDFYYNETLTLERIHDGANDDFAGTWYAVVGGNIIILTIIDEEMIGENFWVIADPSSSYSMGGTFTRNGNRVSSFFDGDLISSGTFNPAAGTLVVVEYGVGTHAFRRLFPAQ